MDKKNEGGGQYRIGDLTLDTATHELRRGDVSIPLPPLSYRLLALLTERVPALVTHDEIVEYVWSGRAVSPETLTQRVKLLRQAIDDDAQEPRYIGLVRGEGYRLVADVADIPDPAEEVVPAALPRHGRWLRVVRPGLAALVLVAAAASALAYLPGFLDTRREAGPDYAERIPREKTIAVLPFTDMSAAGDRSYLGEGIADEILHRLADARGLHVIARTSSFALGDAGLGARDIAGRLGARYLLQGSIRDAGDHLRITAQLVDALDDTQLWSEAYERRLDDAMSVQGDIAGALVPILEFSLSDRPARRTPDPAAYKYYVEGNFFYKRRSDGDMDRAEASFRQALAIDPTLARAWVGLAAVSYIRLWEDGTLDYAESVDRQRRALKEAIALDPDLAEAHVRLFNLYWQTGEADLARAHFDRGRELDPHHPLVLGISATLAAAHGDLERAITLNRQAAARDPLSALAHHNLAVRLMSAGRLEEAETQFARADALNPRASASQQLPRVALRILQGHYAEALQILSDAADSADRDALIAIAMHGLGRHDEAALAVGRLEARSGALATVRLAEVRAFMGDHDAPWAALASIEALCAAGPESIHEANDALNLLRDSPFLDSTRHEAEWRSRLVDAGNMLTVPDQS